MDFPSVIINEFFFVDSDAVAQRTHLYISGTNRVNGVRVYFDFITCKVGADPAGAHELNSLGDRAADTSCSAGTNPTGNPGPDACQLAAYGWSGDKAAERSAYELVTLGTAQRST